METKAVGSLFCDSWRNSPTRRPVVWTLLTRTAREYPTWRAFGANRGVKLLFTIRRLGVSIGKSTSVNRSTNKRSVHFIRGTNPRPRGSSMADFSEWSTVSSSNFYINQFLDDTLLLSVPVFFYLQDLFVVRDHLYFVSYSISSSRNSFFFNSFDIIYNNLSKIYP